MSAREIAAQYVRDAVCDPLRAEWIVSLIEAADAVELDDYGDEIHWIILRIGKHTAAWNDFDGWDCSEAAIEMATLAERKRIIAKLGVLLAQYGCDCDCGCDTDGHDDDCRRCLGCRIADELEAESQP